MVSTIDIRSQEPSFIYFYFLAELSLNQNPAHVEATFSTLGLSEAK